MFYVYFMVYTRAGKSHDYGATAFTKSFIFKMFSIHTNALLIQIYPLWRAFSKSSIFGEQFIRISSVDGALRT